MERSALFGEAPSTIAVVGNHLPGRCGIATFTEEAREFIQRANPERAVLVVSHTDGRGEGVFPLIDMSRRDWWRPVAEKIEELDPYAVHLEHEYGLYEYRDERGVGDGDGIRLYYGAADTYIALATASLPELLAWLEEHNAVKER